MVFAAPAIFDRMVRILTLAVSLTSARGMVTPHCPNSTVDLVRHSHSLQPFYISVSRAPAPARYHECDCMYPDALASQPATLAQPCTIRQRRTGASLLWRVVTLAERCACIVALLLLSPIWLTIAVAITVL